MTYGAIEISVEQGSPVELYEFVYENIYLRFTSGPEAVTWGGNIYTPYAMKRDPIKEVAGTIDQTLTITAFQDFPPAQLFLVQMPSAIMSLTLRRQHLLDPDLGFAVFWIGRVLNAAWSEASEVKMQCETDLSSLRRVAPTRPYQVPCPYTLYGNGCRLNPALNVVTVTSFTADGYNVTVPGLAGQPDNYYAGGYLTYQSTLTGVLEVFAIRLSSAGVLLLALVPYGIETALTMNVYRGCAHTAAACKSFANADNPSGTNFENYGGQLYIPGVNPFAGAVLF